MACKSRFTKLAKNGQTKTKNENCSWISAVTLSQNYPSGFFFLNLASKSFFHTSLVEAVMVLLLPHFSPAHQEGCHHLVLPSLDLHSVPWCMPLTGYLFSIRTLSSSKEGKIDTPHWTELEVSVHHAAPSSVDADICLMQTLKLSALVAPSNLDLT